MTDVQKQHLLGYLGYYEGNADGIWGPLSMAALVQFQEDWGITETGFGAETEEKLRRVIGDGLEGDWWSGIRYWSREEFRCRCGGKYCDGFPAEPERKLVELADAVRGHFGKPGIASSGLRCAAHNSNCGGVKNSRHLRGKALDFCISGVPAAETLGYVKGLDRVRYAYAIDDNYIHMDIE